MIVKIVNELEAKKVLFDPEIYKRCSGESPPSKDFRLPKARYVAGYIKGVIFGIVVYYDRGWFDSIHINVLKQYRGKYAGIFGKKALLFSLDKPLFTNISEEFEDVIRFVEVFGFQLVGEKNDQLVYRRG